MTSGLLRSCSLLACLCFTSRRAEPRNSKSWNLYQPGHSQHTTPFPKSLGATQANSPLEDGSFTSAAEACVVASGGIRLLSMLGGPSRHQYYDWEDFYFKTRKSSQLLRKCRDSCCPRGLVSWSPGWSSRWWWSAHVCGARVVGRGQ